MVGRLSDSHESVATSFDFPWSLWVLLFVLLCCVPDCLLFFLRALATESWPGLLLIIPCPFSNPKVLFSNPFFRF